MDIILARHGNTFHSAEQSFYIGCNNDIPLTSVGIQQAEALAHYLRSQAIQPKTIYCGPLRRTVEYAKIITQALLLPNPPTIDHRLNELDYGRWSGLKTQEIILRFGEHVLQSWEQKSDWPKNSGWLGSPSRVRSEVADFMTSVMESHSANDTILVISSNGKLRYFLTLIQDEFEKHIQKQSFKLGTGNIGKIVIANGQYTLDFWNKNPTTL